MKFQVGDKVNAYDGELKLSGIIVGFTEEGLLKVESDEMEDVFNPKQCRKVKDNPSTFQHLNRVIHSFQKFHELGKNDWMSEKYLLAQETLLGYIEKAEKHLRKPVEAKKK